MHDKGQQPPGLWSTRYLVNGRIQITRGAPTGRGDTVEWLESAGPAWRRLPRAAQWLIAIVIFSWLQGVAAPAGLIFALLMITFLAVTRPDVAAARRRFAGPEAVLAAADFIEARVAGAACRAWEETVAEPSWSSPTLAAARASFDGRAEVDTIVDLALRIHATRKTLGPRPTGPAGSYWQEQRDALDRAALRLGQRADALIRHRDQAAALSAELAQLAELERLERSALLIDDLTIETSAAPAHAGTPVSEQIEAVRQAVSELIEVMNRTRAPLAEPPLPPMP